MNLKLYIWKGIARCWWAEVAPPGRESIDGYPNHHTVAAAQGATQPEALAKGLATLEHALVRAQ